MTNIDETFKFGANPLDPQDYPEARLQFTQTGPNPEDYMILVTVGRRWDQHIKAPFNYAALRELTARLVAFREQVERELNK
jgi:hypothetical protein